MAIQIFFLIVALITLVSAVMVVVVRRMMHAALWLILSLFGVALLFAMLDSAFFRGCPADCLYRCDRNPGDFRGDAHPADHG